MSWKPGRTTVLEGDPLGDVAERHDRAPRRGRRPGSASTSNPRGARSRHGGRTSPARNARSVGLHRRPPAPARNSRWGELGRPRGRPPARARCQPSSASAAGFMNAWAAVDADGEDALADAGRDRRQSLLLAPALLVEGGVREGAGADGGEGVERPRSARSKGSVRLRPLTTSQWRRLAPTAGPPSRRRRRRPHESRPALGAGEEPSRRPRPPSAHEPVDLKGGVEQAEQLGCDRGARGSGRRASGGSRERHGTKRAPSV